LVYETQLVMLIEYLVPTQWIQDVPNHDIEIEIWIRTDDSIHLNEKRWQAEEYMNHIKLLKKYQRNDKSKLFFCKEGNWYYGY
jgi:hypothetical protein